MRLARDSDARFESNVKSKLERFSSQPHSNLEVWISRSNLKPLARACNHRMRWTSMRWQRVGCSIFFFIPICCVHRTNLLCVLFEHPRNSGKSVVQQDDKTLIGHWSRRSSFLSAVLRASCLCVRSRLSLHTLTRPNIGLEYIFGWNKQLC